MQARRRGKVVNLSQSLAGLNAGARLALGGLELTNRPMLLVREVIRRRIDRLVLVSSPCGSLDVDLLVGAGLVRELVVPRVSLGAQGMAPATARAIANQRVRHHEIDSAALITGLRAAAAGQAAAAVPGTATATGRQENRLLREYTGPSGQPELAVRALATDVALLHVPECDEFGNSRHLGAPFYDRLLARASRRVIVQTDRLVTTEEVAGEPGATSLSGHLVDAVVPAPMAAHPTASSFHYCQDEEALWEYATAAVTEEGFQAYLRDTVRGAATQREYLAKLPADRREALEQWWDAGEAAVPATWNDHDFL